jgi:predicted negative regulator of RcsB-dependent stress response
MRATLADASLARDAGRFVWLELNFDKPVNQAFLAQHAVMYTPSFFVIDPADERTTATQIGGMTLPELRQFLDRGEHGVIAKGATPSDAALARGDQMLARGQHAEAAAAYHEALRLGGKTWPQRERAVGAVTWALMLSGQSQACAETAALEAASMTRGQMFGRVVLAGLMCVNPGQQAPWAEAARKTLMPLAEEAIALPTTLRDHRFQLYQQLMHAADARDDKATLARWGDRWLDELEATRPANDDERSALDIARVDAASFLGAASRVLPALIASERAMPTNYNASLRLAQMEIDAKRYDDAIAACDRGLVHVSGPLGRTWLFETKADALTEVGRPAEARRVLEEALQSAQAIGVKQMRDHNIEKISNAIKELPKDAK